MKLFLDQNLSFRLVVPLAGLNPGSTHVRNAGFITGETNSLQLERSSPCEEEAESVDEALRKGRSPSEDRESAPAGRKGGVSEG